MDRKKVKPIFVLTFALLAFVAGGVSFLFAEDESQGEKEEWVVTEKKEEPGYDFSSYGQDVDVNYSLDGETFKLDKPTLKRGDEMWVPLDAILPKMGAMLLKLEEDSFCIIRSDGTPLEFKTEDTVVKMNKYPFLTLDRPPRIYSGGFLLTAESLAKALGVSYAYEGATNTVNFSREGIEEFSTFVVEKPKPIVEEKPLPPPEIKPLPPPDVREEMLPPEYQQDIDMKADATFSYLLDKFAHDRTRQADVYLSGRAYDYRVDGRFRMRDIRTTEKQRFKEDGEFLGLYGDNLWFKFLDNYITMPQVRSQSQSYFGMEVTDFYDPFKSTIIVGETDNSVAGPANVGSVRYLGDLYAVRQEYTDPNGLFRAEAIALWHQTGADNETKVGTTTYPRRNLLYLLDTTTYLYPNLNLYGTYALSNYVPDNKVNANFMDNNWKMGLSLDEKLYTFKAFYEHVGQQYASISTPSTYQDYDGFDFSTGFKFTPNWSANLGGRVSKNNVERNPRRPTNFDRSLSAGTAFQLPWQQTLSLSHSVTESITRGDNVDQSGSRYKDYRIDYSKIWGNLTMQLSYDHYLLDPSGTSTGGLFTDSYSTTLFQFFPEFNNSYLRFYQDKRMTKDFADASYTTTYWNTDIGARWNLTSYLSASADLRVATTEREAFKDTALRTLIIGGEFKSSPVTTWNIDYTLSNYDIYNPENQTTKHYTVMFKVRHIFDVETPEKWGKVKILIYEDLNSDGKRDEGEPGIPDVRVNIINGRLAYTDSKGMAVIKKVVPGERKVKVDLSRLSLDKAVRDGPPVKAVTVAPMKISYIEFSIVSTGKLKGRVFIDMNKNGKYDKKLDEVIQNARIYIVPSGKETLTFSDGSYYFDYVYPGEHEAAIDLATVPSHYKLSSPEKIKVSLKGKETLDALDFIFSPRPIVVESFEGKE